MLMRAGSKLSASNGDGDADDVGDADDGGDGDGNGGGDGNEQTDTTQLLLVWRA